MASAKRRTSSSICFWTAFTATITASGSRMFLWREYNDLFFGGAIRVEPVLYVPTSPYGAWVGLCRYNKNLYLMYPGTKRPWGCLRGFLLHEMIHQRLHQIGKNSDHTGEP